MKKVRTCFVILVVLCLCVMVSGCGKASSSGNPKEETIKVAVVKQLDHASLDEIAAAVTGELDSIAAKEGIKIEYQLYSGQNDQSVLQSIGREVTTSGYDAIIPIATLAAQVMTASAESTEIPVIFAAVSDPQNADLTGISYLTGTSDALNTAFIMDMMFKADPEIKTVGLLYSLSETNSAVPIAEAKKALSESGIAYIEATGNTTDEVIAAASSLISQGAEAIFTPTDNVIMAAELAIAPMFAEAGIPHYAGADSFVRNGAFATCGVNYTDLGKRTAQIAYEVIKGSYTGLGSFEYIDGGIITVNTETAAQIGLDTAVFKDMGTLVEVTTTAE